MGQVRESELIILSTAVAKQLTKLLYEQCFPSSDNSLFWFRALQRVLLFAYCLVYSLRCGGHGKVYVIAKRHIFWRLYCLMHDKGEILCFIWNRRENSLG